MNSKLRSGALRYLKKRFNSVGVEAVGKLLALAVETGAGDDHDCKQAEAKINKQLLYERKILSWLREQIESLKD